MRAPRPVPPLSRAAAHGIRAFTLVEIMVSLSVLAVLVGILSGILNSVSRGWTDSTARIGQFREAREAFDSMNRRLREATLNTYLDYFDANGNARTPATAAAFVPARYGRASELRFVSGPAARMGFPASSPKKVSHCVFFAAPTGYTTRETTAYPGNGEFSRLNSLLNTCGYYVDWNRDTTVPDFLVDRSEDDPMKPSQRWRYRLMEFQQPSQRITVFPLTQAQPGYKGKEWFLDAFKAQEPPARVLAENVVALILQPKLAAAEEKRLKDAGIIAANAPAGTALAPGYLYDSVASSGVPELNPKHQLPPVLSVTLVALDEREWTRRLASNAGALDALRTLLASRFSDAGRLSGDLAALTHFLRDQGVVSRMFSTDLRINAAKWSRE